MAKAVKPLWSVTAAQLTELRGSRSAGRKSGFSTAPNGARSQDTLATVGAGGSGLDASVTDDPVPPAGNHEGASPCPARIRIDGILNPPLARAVHRVLGHDLIHWPRN